MKIGIEFSSVALAIHCATRETTLAFVSPLTKAHLFCPAKINIPALWPSPANAKSQQLYSPQIKINAADVYEDDGRDYVTYAERSRQYRRTVYTWDNWLDHRYTTIFFREIYTSFRSGVVRNLLGEVAGVTALAVAMCSYNALFAAGYVDWNGIEHEPVALLGLYGYDRLPVVGIPALAFSLTSASLGLLLVFRTNASYGRWDEARKFWGLNINHSRNILRQASAWSSPVIEPDVEVRREKLRVLARAIWSFARSLQRHLSDPRTEDEFVAELRARLTPEEADAIIAASHRPNRAMQFMTTAVNDLPMHEMRRNEIDKSIIKFEDTCGGSERLFSSPVPLSYTHHTARFLSAWLLLLPLSLYDQFALTWNHVGMIPCSAMISMFLFGIEEIAVQLEEPFSILPMQGFSNKIGANVDEIANWHGKMEQMPRSKNR